MTHVASARITQPAAAQTGADVTTLQAFIIIMGLAGQVLIARKDPRGYVAWIAGNLALVVVYVDTQQHALVGLQVVNSAIQASALIRWMRDVRGKPSWAPRAALRAWRRRIPLFERGGSRSACRRIVEPHRAVRTSKGSGASHGADQCGIDNAGRPKQARCISHAWSASRIEKRP